MPKAANLPAKDCAVCGTEFIPAHSRSRYCSKQCLWKSKNDRYRLANPEKYLAHSRASYAKHREKRRAYMRERYAKDPEAWYSRNELYRLNTRNERPWYMLLRYAEKRAEKKSVPFDLTDEWAVSAWTGACAVSGLSFVTGHKGHGPRPRTPSIDRIEPSLGYVQSNCRFVIHAVNALKGDGTEEEMMEVVRSILLRHS